MIQPQGLRTGFITESERLRIQHDLRKRCEAIIRELGRVDKLLSDEQILELNREYRRLRVELNSFGREGAA